MIWNRMAYKVTAVRDNEMGEPIVDLLEHLEELLEPQGGLEPQAPPEPVEHHLRGVERLQPQERHLPVEIGEMPEFLWLVWEAALVLEKRKNWVYRPPPPQL